MSPELSVTVWHSLIVELGKYRARLLESLCPGDVSQGHQEFGGPSDSDSPRENLAWSISFGKLSSSVEDPETDHL